MSGRSRSVHFEDDEAQETADMHHQQEQEEEQPRIPASQQMLYRAFMAANAIAEYGGRYVCRMQG